MPNYHFKEIWTPLKLIRIRFFRDDQDRLWIKVFNNQRRLLKKAPSEQEGTGSIS